MMISHTRNTPGSRRKSAISDTLAAHRFLAPSLVSFALLLVISCVAPVWADPLADEMASMNARWDAAISNADFDALLPMYTGDARLMPPGTQPVTGAMAIRNSFAGRGRGVSNHKLELVDVLLIGSHAYVTSHFIATLVANEKAPPSLAAP
jgi:ketosteroid isomerase-like protein